MSWDYAELSKAAKDAGGPEKLMDMLVDSGKDIGHKDMLPVVGIALGVGALSYAGISKRMPCLFNLIWRILFTFKVLHKLTYSCI